MGAGQQMAVAGADVESRLVAVDAAIMRGVADGGADVAAEFETRQPRRERRRAAARRAARRALDVPGIVGGSVDRIEGLPVGKPDGHVGLAEHDRAGLLQPRDGQRVVLRDIVAMRRQAPRARRSHDVEGFLHRHRHAMQRAERLALRRQFVAPRGFLARFLGAPDDYRVDSRIVALDAREKEVEEFNGADLLLPHQRGERARRSESKFVVHVVLPFLPERLTSLQPPRQDQAARKRRAAGLPQATARFRARRELQCSFFGVRLKCSCRPRAVWRIFGALATAR